MLNFNDIFVDDTKYGMKIPKEKYLSVGLYPVIDQSKEQIAGYTDESEGIYCDVPAIIFGDHTRIIKYIDVPFFLGADGTKLLKIKDNTAFNCKYLYYALSNAKIPNTGYNRHFKWLKELSFNIPSIEKQREIADLMDIIVNLENLRKKQLEKLELFVKSRFIEMFGDPIRNDKELPLEPLGKHIELLGGFAFKSTGFAKEGIPVLRIGNINAGYFRPDNLPFWKYDKALDRYLLYPGDLAISLTGTVGKDDYGNICKLGNDYPRYYLNQRNAKLVLKETVLPEFITALLKNKKVKDKIINTGVGVRQANISNKSILELEVPIPNLVGQNQFASFVMQVDKSKLAIQQSLDELETLKKSLMQQYFG